MNPDFSKYTQLDFILQRLEEKGEVTRNECLRNYITRLGSRIWDLRQDGFEFDILRREGDYVYKLVRDPRKVPVQLQMI